MEEVAPINQDMIYGVGNTSNPEIVLVLPYPETEEWEKRQLLVGSRGKLIRDALGDNVGKAYVTCLAKTLEPADLIGSIRNDWRRPTPEELEKWVPLLRKEIQRFEGATIMTLGKACTRAVGRIDPNHEFRAYAGKVMDWEGIRLIPNYDPQMAKERAHLVGEFRRFVNKALVGDQLTDDFQHKICDYDESMEVIERTIDLHKSGKIPWFLFDIETTGFRPQTDDIIMFVVAHEADPVSYSIPLVVNNNVHPDWKNDWSEVDIHISAQQAAKIKGAMGRCIEEVPFAGHNLKFDMKFCHRHGVGHLFKMKILHDTLIMAFMLYNR